jgi:hypothetical protein
MELMASYAGSFELIGSETAVRRFLKPGGGA